MQHWREHVNAVPKRGTWRHRLIPLVGVVVLVLVFASQAPADPPPGCESRDHPDLWEVS